MVFHVGIAPLCGEMAVFNTTNIRTKIDDFREVGKNDVELIEGMYKRIKSIAKGELGYAGICLGSSYGNEIRQKFIKHGLECGFKKIEIIDWETQMFLNAISQSGYQPKNGDTICVLNGKLCHFWEKSNGKSQYRGSANGIFNDKNETDKSDFIKDPNVIIFEAEDENQSDTIEKIFPQCLVAFYENNNSMGALIKARLMANDDENVLGFDFCPKLDRNLSIKIGERKIMEFEASTLLPLKKSIKFKVEENEQTFSVVFGYFNDQIMDSIKLPINKEIDFSVEIDTNGIVFVKF
jgi:hypothetical protein